MSRNGSSTPSRQLDRNTGAATGLARQRDAATMGLDDRAADVQAQAGAPLRASAPAFRAIEAIKDARQVLGRDPHAAVGHPEPDARPIRPAANRDAAAGGCVRQSIV